MKLYLYTYIQFITDILLMLTKRFQLRPLQSLRVWAWTQVAKETLKTCNTRKVKKIHF